MATAPLLLLDGEGTILTSPDGASWTQRSSGTTTSLDGVTYGNGTFVAVGSYGKILQSDSITNNQPSKPVLVYPANNQMGLGTTVTFSWKKSTDIDGDAIAYNLYVCEDQGFTECNPIQIASLSKNSYFFTGIGRSIAGLFLIGIMISGLRGKRKIYLMIAVLIVTCMFIISCGGGDGGTPVTGDEITHTVSGLSGGTTYYWKVLSDDGKGGTTESDIWNFTTW